MSGVTRHVLGSERALVDRVEQWRRRQLAGVSRPGTLLAVLGYVSANTPSLLPRHWWLQGIIAAICGLSWYVVGVGLGALGRVLARWSGLEISIDATARWTLLSLWYGLVAVGVIVFPVFSLRWQQVTSGYVGMPAPGPSYVLGSTVAAFVSFVVLVMVWRLVAALFDWLLARFESHALRDWLARIVASVATVALILLFLDRVALPGGLDLAQRAAERVNAENPTGYHAPTSSLRSGGPGSSQPWSSLGQDGEIFVSAGPTADQIAAVTGRPAREPIRVFVGAGDGSLAQRVAAVVAELDRTGAFARKALNIEFATSTGYLNIRSVAAFEFLTGGDCATVSMQYSTLPSATALLTAGSEPVQAARALFDGVLARVRQLPAGQRPAVYVGGESLGAYGGNGVFATPTAMLAEVAGAVWTGTPYFTPLRRTLTAQRTPGSTEVDPVVDDGAHVRFAGTAAQLVDDQWGRPLGSWSFPRVVYLQHVSDPVAWWSPDLLFSSPGWLNETRGNDAMAQMSWLPFVTFWQVTADLTMSNEVPYGHGHRYGAADVVPAWAAVLGQDPTANYATIEQAIDELSS